MALHQVDLDRVQVGFGVCAAQGPALAFDVGRCDPLSLPIRACTHAAQHGVDPVPVTLRIAEALEN